MHDSILSTLLAFLRFWEYLNLQFSNKLVNYLFYQWCIELSQSIVDLCFNSQYINTSTKPFNYIHDFKLKSQHKIDIISKPTIEFESIELSQSSYIITSWTKWLFVDNFWPNISQSTTSIIFNKSNQAQFCLSRMLGWEARWWGVARSVGRACGQGHIHTKIKKVQIFFAPVLQIRKKTKTFFYLICFHIGGKSSTPTFLSWVGASAELVQNGVVAKDL